MGEGVCGMMQIEKTESLSAAPGGLWWEHSECTYEDIKRLVGIGKEGSGFDLLVEWEGLRNTVDQTHGNLFLNSIRLYLAMLVKWIPKKMRT